MTRDDAIKDIVKETCEGCLYIENCQREDCSFYLAIKALEARPQGEWIDAYPEIEKNPMFNYGICSRCKFEQSMSNKLNFCPNCGADMRKTVQNE